MRVAIYYAPPVGHPLGHAAAEWLGRDAASGDRCRQESAGSLSAEEVSAITAEPRRYGFHATLKAPFRLRDEVSLSELEAAARDFCDARGGFVLPHLQVRGVDRFVALTPECDCAALADLADAVVRGFEPYRAPLAESEVARRREAGLTEPQDRNLLDWGYPYVFHDFRFHMTLTGPLDPDLRAVALDVLRERFAAPLRQPLKVDGLALFVEPEPGAEFAVHARFPFARHEIRND